MTEITTPITTSAPSVPSVQSNTDNNVTTTTIIPPSIPPDNVNNSEYQRSYSWKLPMVKINKPKERTKSEYQREFTWKNDTPSPAPSPALIPPSPIPQESLTECNTPEPIIRSSSTTVNNAIAVDSLGSKLNELSITNKNTSSTSLNESKHNGTFVSEPEDNSILEKFNSNNNAADRWKDGLRNPEPRQSVLASSMDPRTKRIVALEANRLSKKSRSKSMYSLHDQLKVCETAKDLSNPYGTEYNSEFVNWKEYGTAVREDTAANKRRQTSNSGDHTLKRRGSWSASANNTLPAPLKWLEDLNIDLGSRAYTREKLQPTISDSKSIRGLSTTITAKNSSRSARDYNYYDEKRPTTSADVRDYRYERPTTSADVRDYRYERPTTSADVRDYPRPVTSLRENRYDDDDDNYYNTRRNFDYSYSKKDRNSSPLRSSTTLGHYRDHYKDTPDVSSQYYDNRNNDSSSSRKDYDYKYDDRKYDKYDDRKYNDRKYDDRRYDDIRYDDSRKYDDRKYDDRKYDDKKYDDRKRDIVYDDRKRENGYEDRKLYDDRQRENVYDDRQRDGSPSYDYDHRRRDNNYEGYDFNKYNNRAAQISDQEHYSLGHSRNPSYASSNKGSVHDEPTGYSGAPLPYLDAVRHRSSVSSLSSVSTPSSPATPTTSYDNDYRWKRSSGLDPRIYKEQTYSPSVISKSSYGSHGKYWEDEKDKNYHPSVLSPSRNKFYIDDDDDDEHAGGYSSKRQSRDYKPTTSSAMRYSLQYSPTPTRSTSPSRDSYGSSRKHYNKSGSHSNYSSRPPSRATSVSSHATSIEEESAVLTDILKEAELITMKNLSQQRNIFKQPVDLSGIGAKNSGRSTPSVKRSSLAGQKKPTTTTTTKTTKTTTKTTKPAGVKTSKTTPPTRSSSRASTTTTTKATKGVPPSNKKVHRPSSSLSSISSTSSYREAYQPPPTNFSAAREALSRARMKVEEMLEIVSNGGTLD